MRCDLTLDMGSRERSGKKDMGHEKAIRDDFLFITLVFTLRVFLRKYVNTDGCAVVNKVEEKVFAELLRCDQI